MHLSIVYQSIVCTKLKLSLFIVFKDINDQCVTFLNNVFEDRVYKNFRLNAIPQKVFQGQVE